DVIVPPAASRRSSGAKPGQLAMQKQALAIGLLLSAAAMLPATSGSADPGPAPTPAAAPPGTQGPNADQVAVRVQNFYNQTKTFQADFKQDYTVKMQQKHITSEGHVVFEKPGKMSWTYKDPNGNRVVSDGRRLLVYEQENQQMFEQPVDKSYYPAALSF